LSYIIDNRRISFVKKAQNCGNSVVCHISASNKGVSKINILFKYADDNNLL